MDPRTTMTEVISPPTLRELGSDRSFKPARVARGFLNKAANHPPRSSEPNDMRVRHLAPPSSVDARKSREESQGPWMRIKENRGAEKNYARAPSALAWVLAQATTWFRFPAPRRTAPTSKRTRRIVAASPKMPKLCEYRLSRNAKESPRRPSSPQLAANHGHITVNIVMPHRHFFSSPRHVSSQTGCPALQESPRPLRA